MALFDRVRERIKAGLQSIQGEAQNLGNRAAQGVQSYFAPSANGVRFRDFVRELPGTVADFTTHGTQEFGKTIGQTLAAPYYLKTQQQADQQRSDLNSKIISQIKATTDPGQRARLMKLYQSNQGSPFNIQRDIPALNLTNKQVIGQAGQTALEIAGLGSLPSLPAKFAAMPVAAAATEGGLFAGGFGAAQAAQENKSGAEIAKDAAMSAVPGALFGAAVPFLSKVRSFNTPLRLPFAKDAVASGAEQLVKTATREAPGFAKQVSQVADEVGGTAVHGPVKTAQRITEKVKNEYGGDLSKLSDVNRSAILVKDPQQSLDQALERIKSQFGDVVRVKGNFDTAPGEFKKVIVNVRTPSGSVAEIQLTTPEMWKAKMDLGGDELYHQVRTKKGDWEAADKKMRSLYQDAEATAAARSNSASETSEPSARALMGGYSEPVAVTPKTSSVLGSTSTLTNVPSTSKNLGKSAIGVDHTTPATSSLSEANRGRAGSQDLLDRAGSMRTGKQLETPLQQTGLSSVGQSSPAVSSIENPTLGLNDPSQETSSEARMLGSLSEQAPQQLPASGQQFRQSSATPKTTNSLSAVFPDGTFAKAGRTAPAQPFPAQEGAGVALSLPSKSQSGSLDKNLTLNTNNYNISPEAKKELQTTIENIKPKLQEIKGGTLTNDEVVNAAIASDALQKVVTKEDTLKVTATITKLREQIAAGAEGKGISEDFIKNLQVLKAMSSDTGRRLQAFSINVDPSNTGVKEEIVKQLIGLGNEADKIIEASKNVDFSNPTQVTKFYRQFVEPTKTQLVDEYRYINLLSNPHTHIVNAFSNMLQVGLNPVTKLYSGAVDSIGSALTGAERQHYINEVPAYARGVLGSVQSAASDALAVMRGEKFGGRPDVRQLGTGNRFLDKASIVPKALEASDVFFRSIIQAGEKEALAKKFAQQGKTVSSQVLDQMANEKAQYWVFRGPVDPSNATKQGALLSHIDGLTSAIQKARKVPFVSWFIPFVQTPMNITKQMIEFSPAGLATIPGAANKTEQLAKALVGSTVMAGAGALVMNTDSTWSVPTGKTAKEEFYAAGRQPYSVKINGNWVDYSKLGPLAFPIAIAAAVKQELKDNPKANSETSWKKLESVLGDLGKFVSDQSYVKGIGDLVSFAQGDEQAGSQLGGDFLNQMVPLEALQGFVARIIDPVFRKTNNAIDSVKATIPFLSKTLEPYTDNAGQPSQRPYPVINGLSPVKVAPADQQKEDVFKLQQSVRQSATDLSAAKDSLKSGKPFLKTGTSAAQGLPDGVIAAGGKYLYKSGDEVKTADTPEAAAQGIRLDAFKSSGKAFEVDGDTVFRRNTDGSVKTTPKDEYDYSLNTRKLASAKGNGDVAGWMQLAGQQLQIIDKQLQDGSLDELEQADLEAKAEKLLTDMQKYRGYGGFTKPKKAKKLKTPSLSGSTGTFKVVSPTTSASLPKLNLGSTGKLNAGKAAALPTLRFATAPSIAKANTGVIRAAAQQAPQRLRFATPTVAQRGAAPRAAKLRVARG